MDYMTFVEENLTVIIIVAVVVLMTIIGYFADKKYSGSEKPVKEKKEKNKKEEHVEEVVEDVTNDFDVPSDIEPSVTDMEDIPAEELFSDIPDFSNEESIEPLPVEPVEEQTNIEEKPEDLFEGVDVPAEEPVEQDISELPLEETNEEVEENSDLTVEPVVEEQSAEEAPVNVSGWDTIEPTSSDEPTVSFDETEVPYNDMNEEVPDAEEEENEWMDTDKVPVEEDSIADNNNITFDGVNDEDFQLPTLDAVNNELSEVESDDDDVWKF